MGHVIGVVPPRRPEESKEQESKVKEVGLIEAKIHRVIELLGNILEDTKGKVQRKQAQTIEELQAELLEQEQQIIEEEESEEEDEYIYNPLKLPLGALVSQSLLLYIRLLCRLGWKAHSILAV